VGSRSLRSRSSRTCDRNMAQFMAYKCATPPTPPPLDMHDPRRGGGHRDRGPIQTKKKRGPRGTGSEAGQLTLGLFFIQK
jgi:hypothetical protein